MITEGELEFIRYLQDNFPLDAFVIYDNSLEDVSSFTTEFPCQILITANAIKKIDYLHLLNAIQSSVFLVTRCEAFRIKPGRVKIHMDGYGDLKMRADGGLHYTLFPFKYYIKQNNLLQTVL